MSWVAVGVGGAMVVGGTVASMSAGSKAAKAQRKEAERQRAAILAQGKENQEKALALAKATPEELAVLTRANASAVSALDREEKLLAALDPTIMEASQQALKLLRGESAGATQALMNQRQVQRQSLVNSLRSQFGPSAETSSVGQRALQQFDMESNTMMTQANSNAFNQVFGAASADYGARTQRANEGLQNVGRGYSALQERLLNTQLNTGNSILGALSGTAQSMIESAGYKSVGQQIMGSSLTSVGGQVFGAGMGSAMGGAKPTNSPGGGGNSGRTSGGYGLSNPGTTDDNFWGSNPYAKR